MKSGEYERRRRAIEEQLQADLDLMRAACQARLRALETVWLHSAGGGEETLRQEELQAPAVAAPRGTVPRETVPEEIPAGEPVQVSRPSDVLSDVRAILSSLPEVFSKKDLSQALGYKVSRTTLYRALGTLQRENAIEIAVDSDGRNLTQYRRLTEA